MKIDFIIISIILVITCFLPFILFPLIANSEEKSLKKRFKEEVQKLGLNISYELHWNTNRIGIDILKKQFLFVQKTEIGFDIRQVDLTKVHDITILQQNHIFKLQGRPEEVLTRIDLEFYVVNFPAPMVVTLFDHDQNYNQDFELKNAQQLVMELRKYLTIQPLLKHTA